MKRQQKQIMMLILVLVLLGAGFLVLKQYNKSQAEQSQEEKLQEEGEIIINAAVEEVVKLSYDYEENNYVFEKQDGVWYYAQDHSLSISQSQIEDMLAKVAGLTARETIRDVTDMEQYGLKDSYRTISFDTQGQSYLLMAGDYNSVTGMYYVYLPGQAVVYAVDQSVVDGFDYTLEQLIEAPEETEEGTQSPAN